MKREIESSFEGVRITYKQSRGRNFFNIVRANDSDNITLIQQFIEQKYPTFEVELKGNNASDTTTILRNWIFT